MTTPTLTFCSYSYCFFIFFCLYLQHHKWFKHFSAYFIVLPLWETLHLRSVWHRFCSGILCVGHLKPHSSLNVLKCCPHINVKWSSLGKKKYILQPTSLVATAVSIFSCRIFSQDLKECEIERSWRQYLRDKANIPFSHLFVKDGEARYLTLLSFIRLVE